MCNVPCVGLPLPGLLELRLEFDRALKFKITLRVQSTVQKVAIIIVMTKLTHVQLATG